MANYAWDHLLWGNPENQNPMYGYYRVGAIAGGSPNLGAYLQVSPVAPIVFEVQRSLTHRFVDHSNFDCDVLECQGRVDRTDYSAKIAGAYQNFFLVSSILFRDVRTSNSDKKIVIELEDLVVTPGTHRFTEINVVLGYRLPEKKFVALLSTTGEVVENKQRFESVYGIYHWPWNEYGFTAGGGHYRSFHKETTGTSFLLSVSRKWGQSLSLF